MKDRPEHGDGVAGAVEAGDSWDVVEEVITGVGGMFSRNGTGMDRVGGSEFEVEAVGDARSADPEVGDSERDTAEGMGFEVEVEAVEDMDGTDDPGVGDTDRDEAEEVEAEDGCEDLSLGRTTAWLLKGQMPVASKPAFTVWGRNDSSQSCFNIAGNCFLPTGPVCVRANLRSIDCHFPFTGRNTARSSGCSQWVM